MWAQIVNMILGAYLMAAPALIGYTGAPAYSDRIVGPFIVTFGAVAFAQSTRGVRYWQLPLALWLMIGPIVLAYPLEAAANSIGVGFAVFALSLVRGRISHTFASGWRVLFQPGGCGRFDEQGRPRDVPQT